MIEDALLDEVTALVEWPVPIAGQFEQRFLSLPREVVIATVQDHQRYFAVQGADGKLSGWFVTVSNIESRDPSKVREGNERVVRPRLSDAAFFWEQDRKISLEAHAARLSGVTFQAKLGSYADKTARVTELAELIGGRIGAGAGVGQAAELAKADLMTAMVGEFPELQGTMGRYYAEAQGLPREVSRGHRGALSSALCRRCAALDEDRPGRGAGRQDRHAGRNFCHRAAADRRQGSLRLAPRRLGRVAHFARVAVGLGFARGVGGGGCRAAGASEPAWPTRFTISSPSGCADLLLEEPGTTAEMLDAVLANRPRSPLDARHAARGVEGIFAAAGCRRAGGDQQAHREYSEKDARGPRLGRRSAGADRGRRARHCITH